jgi:hypothetical protein
VRPVHPLGVVSPHFVATSLQRPHHHVCGHRRGRDDGASGVNADVSRLSPERRPPPLDARPQVPPEVPRSGVGVEQTAERHDRTDKLCGGRPPHDSELAPGKLPQQCRDCQDEGDQADNANQQPFVIPPHRRHHAGLVAVLLHASAPHRQARSSGPLNQ